MKKSERGKVFMDTMRENMLMKTEIETLKTLVEEARLSRHINDTLNQQKIKKLEKDIVSLEDMRTLAELELIEAENVIGEYQAGNERLKEEVEEYKIGYRDITYICWALIAIHCLNIFIGGI